MGLGNTRNSNKWFHGRWKMIRNVLVTGAEGFIGSHLTEELVFKGYNVKAFVFYNSNNSWGWLDTLSSDVKKEIEIISGDIRDADFLRRKIQNIDMIFHLAALIAIPFSYESPDLYIDTNVRGTLNVLQAARYGNVQKILVTSTSEVYGTARYFPMDENHPLTAQSPYAASKIASDKIAESFFRSYSLPVVIVRPFNTYGPRQSLRAVIPSIILQLLGGSQKIHLGSVYPTRDFTYVKDTVKGFISIAESDKVIGEVIQIASGHEISIGQLAEKIINLINPSAQICFDQERLRPQNSEVFRLFGSNEKIYRITGWQPDYSFDEGLKKTIEWMRQSSQLEKANLYQK